MTVENHPVLHDTIRLERQLPHPPSAVFAAYADVEQRVVWTEPSDGEIVIFEADDFRIGGMDRFLCGPRDAPDFIGTTRYADQVTSLAGQGPIDGSRKGYAAILDRVVDHLGNS